MSLLLNNNSKNNFSIINDDRTSNNLTWNDMTGTWDSQTGTWQNPKYPTIKENKNNLSITNENKN